MSDFHILKAEQQAAYKRWEMSALPTDGNAHSKQPERRSETRIPDELTAVIEKARKEAFTKGMQDGYMVGLEKGRESAEAAKNSLLKIASELSSAFKQADEKMADELLELALDIAKAMLKTSLEADPLKILPIVKEAIRQLPSVQQPASLGLNPEDATLVRAHLKEELAENHWQIIEDADIERGGCMVVTATNHIDASNSTRWKNISESLGKVNLWDAGPDNADSKERT